jgi:hypothetical protein
MILQIISAILLISLVLIAYLRLARPYQLRWGATDQEVARPMPGDELDPTPTFLSTRAITIQGTSDQIWPWLIQMGYGRAGFYGYDILENIGSPRGMASADRILPEFQNFKVGDRVPISAVAHEIFYAIEPNQYLVWAGETGEHPGGFTWALYPIDGQRTRLVSRIRWSHHWAQPSMLFLELFTEFTDHLAVRKILEGIKHKLEGHSERAIQTNLEFFTFVAAFLIFLAAIVLTLLHGPTLKTGLAGLAAGGAWLVIWYAPVPVGPRIILAFLAVWGLLAAF